MKTLKTRYDYLLWVYVPLTGSSFLLAYFLPNFLTVALRTLFVVTSLLIIVSILLPYSKRIFNTAARNSPPSSRLGIKTIIFLQLALTCLFLNFLINQHQFTAATPTAVSLFSWHYWQWAILIWPLYLLFGLSLNPFLNRSFAFLPIKNMVRPVFRNSTDGVLGAGANFYLRQCFVFISALTLVVTGLQVVAAVLQNLSIPLLPGTNLLNSLFSWLVLAVTNTMLWRKMLRYIWKKEWRFGSICLTLALLIIVSTGFCNALIYLLKQWINIPILFHNLFAVIQQNFNAYPLNLFSVAWWLSWAPLAGLAIAHFAQHQTARRIILSVLPFPCLLGIVIYVLNSEPFAQTSLIEIITNPYSSLVLATFSLGILYVGLNHHEISADLLLKNPERRSSQETIQTRYSFNRLLRLITMTIFIWVLFWLIGKNSIGWINISIALPNLIAVMAMILGGLHLMLKN